MKTTLIPTIVAISSAAFLTACGAPVAQTSAPVYSSGQPVYSSGQPVRTMYGYIDSIQVMAGNDSSGPGVGAVIGGVVGGVLGNQVGGGVGKDIATVAGVVGGAVVGNKIEQSNRAPARDTYQISVRLENGSYQTIQQDSLADLRVGSRVRIENGRVYRN